MRSEKQHQFAGVSLGRVDFRVRNAQSSIDRNDGRTDRRIVSPTALRAPEPLVRLQALKVIQTSTGLR